MTSGNLKHDIYYKTNANRGGFIKNSFGSTIDLDEVENGIYSTSKYRDEASEFPSDISRIVIRELGVLVLGLKGYFKV